MPILHYRNHTVTVPAGDLLTLLRSCDVAPFTDLTRAIASPCGGHGTCGKCIVAVSGGDLSAVTDEETEALGRAGLSAPPEGYVYRLACRCRIETGEVFLALPAERQSGENFLTGAAAAETGETETSAWLTWREVNLVRPTLEEPLTLEENLHRVCPGAVLTPAVSNKLTLIMQDSMDASPRSADPVRVYIAVPASCSDTHAEKGTAEPIPVFDAAAEVHPLYAAAVDLGTTTVALSLWDDAGRRLAGKVIANATRPYGADVISRISYAMDTPDGTAHLCRILRESVETAVRELAEEAGVPLSHIPCRILAGNTVMEHLYAGLNPAPIGKTPFWSQTAFGDTLPDRPDTWLAPCAASYVGGDVVMGAAWLFWKDPARMDKTILFMDLGTNGEIGIYKDGKFTFAATAAGPAFEGAHIAQGMPATPGAVSRIRWEKDAGFSLTTIGDEAPVGLCGSGILDGVCRMLQLGLMDEYGTLVDDPDEWKIPDDCIHGVQETEEEVRCYFAGDIWLSQRDIRQFQTARAAIAAGVEILCRQAGVLPEEIDQVCLAGSFGGGLDPDSAATVGLIPTCLGGRILPVGNTSEAGCAAFWLYREFREILEKVQASSVYTELSGRADFSEVFTEKMCFEVE